MKLQVSTSKDKSGQVLASLVKSRQVSSSLVKSRQVSSSFVKPRQVSSSLDKFGQVWTSLDKFGSDNFEQVLMDLSNSTFRFPKDGAKKCIVLKINGFTVKSRVLTRLV